MNIWVFAQQSQGVPTSATLELLSKARTLGTVTAFVGGDGSAIAGALGEYGAAKVYATGDLGGRLPGVAVSAAMKAVIDGGDSPDLIMFPQSYEGRDVVSRLSVKLDRTVLTNNIDIAVEGSSSASPRRSSVATRWSPPRSPGVRRTWRPSDRSRSIPKPPAARPPRCRRSRFRISEPPARPR